VSAQFRSRIEKLQRAAVLELFSSVIKSTPVDTGRLRGNWQATMGAPASGVVEVLAGATTPKGTVPPELESQVGAVVAKLSGDGSVYLANNLPYAARIEFEGHSKQAPRGMVRVNLVRIANNLRRMIAKKGWGADVA